MTSLFIKILNLSISAGMLILLVFVLRFILKRTSRRATCLLWVVVGLRLVIPFSFESSLSIMPSGDFVKLETAPEAVEVAYTGNENIIGGQSHKITLYTTTTDDNSEIDYNIDSSQNTDLESGKNNLEYYAEQGIVEQNNIEQNNIEQKDNIKNSIEQAYTEQNNDVRIALPTQMPNDTVKTQSNNNDNVQRNGTDNSTSEDYYVSTSNNIFGYPAKHFWGVIAYLWLFGVVAIMGYALVGYIHMKQITAASMKLEDLILSESVVSRFKIKLENVYICDRLDTAFIFGIIHPRIYLPSNLDETQIENVIAHEHVHIMRRDYIWKLIGFLMLAVYWFNPLVWLAYAFLCRDIEFACDEQVISGMNTDEVKRYSETLLYCSTNMHFMYGCPLAFGEIAVKDRVKAALNYKKPLFWVILLVFVLLITAGIFFFAKPKTKITEDIKDNNGVLSVNYFDGVLVGVFDDFTKDLSEDRSVINLSEETINYIVEVKEDLSGRLKNGAEIMVQKKYDKEMLEAAPYQLKIGDSVRVEYDNNTDSSEAVIKAESIYLIEEKYDEDSLEKVKLDQSEVKDTYTTACGVKYYELKDGSYFYDGYTYKYKKILTGRWPGAAHDMTMIYLCNKDDLTFESAYWSMISSNSNDFFSVLEARCVCRVIPDIDPSLNSEIEEEYEAGDDKYYKLKNGMYRWSDYIYKYKIEVEVPIAESDQKSVWVYLSNKEELSLREVQRSNALSAVKYHFTPDVAKFVDCLVDGESTLRKIKVDPDELEETFSSSIVTAYYKLKDGRYKFSGYFFDDRYEISGTVPDVANDNSFYDGYRGKEVKFVYLSNIGEISFERAWKDFSSTKTEEKIPWSDAHMVDFIVLGDEDEDELMQTLKTGQNDRSVYELLNTMSMKYRYSVVHDFDFIYVMPNGTEFGTEFGYTAGMDFREYCKLWNDFDGIIHDEGLTKPWRETKESTNGYLVLATNNGYEDSRYGYKIFIKDEYIHLFSVDKSKEESMGEIDYRSPYQMRSSYNPQTDEYMWSARLKDGYQPNMYSIRRILFNKDMYDIYVQNCDYENYITAPGIYYYNRGYCIDLDGDGEREKLFIASCGWINQPEPENVEGFVYFQGHYGTDYDTYFGNYPKSLIYINGEPQNEDCRIADEVKLPYEFAITDIDRKDGRYEILLTYSSEHQVGDYFYIWKNGHLSEPKIFNGKILQITYDALAYETAGRLSYYPEVKLTADFHRDGTFSGLGDVSIAGDFGYLRLYSDYITWRMDTDGNIKPVGDIFDIPILYENEKEFMDSLVTTWSIEHWEEVMETDPENLYREIYLKLELDLNVSAEPDASSPKTHMPPGYVVIDKTDAKSKIHIRYMTDGMRAVDEGENAGLSGWLDLADIESYVCDTEAFAKAKEENPYGTVIDALFSNLNHAE